MMNEMDWIFFMMLTGTVMMIKSENPMEMSLIFMLTTSMTLMYSMVSISNWFMMIYYMLLIGGILVMIMILASLMPNTFMTKSNMNMFWFPYLILVMFYSPSSVESQDTTIQSSVVMTKNFMIMSVLTMIMMYFISFLYSMKDYKKSMSSMMICL